MKKKNFIMAVAVAAVCAGSVATVNAFSSNDREFTALELANIDALTTPENPLTPPCDNISGYKKWETSGDGIVKKERFRDCCYKEKSGYNPTPCVIY